MHENKDDLEYTADGIREFSGTISEQRVQASMQEETAKAIYALVDSVDEMREELADEARSEDFQHSREVATEVRDLLVVKALIALEKNEFSRCERQLERVLAFADEIDPDRDTEE